MGTLATLAQDLRRPFIQSHYSYPHLRSLFGGKQKGQPTRKSTSYPSTNPPGSGYNTSGKASAKVLKRSAARLTPHSAARRGSKRKLIRQQDVIHWNLDTPMVFFK